MFTYQSQAQWPKKMQVESQTKRVRQRERPLAALTTRNGLAVGARVVAIGALALLLNTAALAQSSQPEKRAAPSSESERAVPRPLPMPSTCRADLSGDGFVDRADLVLVLASFEISTEGDVNADGRTDQADLGAVLAFYGQHCGAIAE